MTATESLLRNNERFAAAFDQGGKPVLPARNVAVLTCMDARLHPERFLGLEVGDAHVVRNAGGRASEDALRSLVVSVVLQGTRECLVIHHTDCGMRTLSNPEVHAKVAAQTGTDASHIDFLPLSAEAEDGVRADVRHIRESPLMPDDLSVRGFVYDVDTGALAPVATEGDAGSAERRPHATG